MQTTSYGKQRRADRAILKVDGAEARHFLHNLLTADIEGLSPGAARYGALLSPQGKILFDVFVFEAGGHFLLDVARSGLAELMKRLTLYRLRAKVGLAVANDLEVGVAMDRPDGGLGYADPRLPEFGFRLFAPVGHLADGSGYDMARIGAGLADSDADLGSGEFFPHEANFDQFGAVSFTKGCYIGQEVVSRMEHRGTARARILPVRLGGAAPPKGSDIRSGEKSIGTLLSSADQAGLALIRLDRLNEAKEPLLTEAVRVTVQKPVFARYDVPGVKDQGHDGTTI